MSVETSSQIQFLFILPRKRLEGGDVAEDPAKPQAYFTEELIRACAAVL
jgi:hypothetical protein